MKMLEVKKIVSALDLLTRKERVDRKELESKLGMPNNEFQDLTKVLVSRGYVLDSQSGTDIHYSITDEGRKALEEYTK
jgi:predicted transcriptional regulator